MKLKIISKGDGSNTRVVNVATGEAIENVTAIEWSLSGDVPIATVTLSHTQIDAVAECEPAAVEPAAKAEEVK